MFPNLKNHNGYYGYDKLILTKILPGIRMYRYRSWLLVISSSPSHHFSPNETRENVRHLCTSTHPSSVYANLSFVPKTPETIIFY